MSRIALLLGSLILSGLLFAEQIPTSTTATGARSTGLTLEVQLGFGATINGRGPSRRTCMDRSLG